MATWVRQGTGTAPSNTDSDLVGQYALDNATTPSDFDPAAVNSVRVEWTVTGSGFNDDSWTNDSCALVTSGGTEISQHPSAGGTNLQNTSEASDHTDSTGIPTGLTTTAWEGAFVRGDGTDIPNEWVNWNKVMGPDGSTLTVSALTVTIDYTPAASDFDWDTANFQTPTGDRNIVRVGTALYAVAKVSDGGAGHVMTMWKSTDEGANWSELDFANRPAADASYSDISVVVDSADDLHASFSAGAGNLRYVTFDTATDTWGTPETLNMHGIGFDGEITHTAIALDANDDPHVAAMNLDDVNGTHSGIIYRNKIGGSWNSLREVQVGGGSYTAYVTVDIVSGVPVLVYSTGGNIRAAEGNALNASSFTAHSVVAVTGPRWDVALDGNDIWIAYRASSNEISLVQHLATDGWTTWQTPTSSGNTGDRPSVAVDENGRVYVLYSAGTGATGNIVKDEYNGSWAGASTLHTGSFSYPRTRYQPLNLVSYSTEGVDYLYFSSSTPKLLYGNFDITTGGELQELAADPIDVSANLSATLFEVEQLTASLQAVASLVGTAAQVHSLTSLLTSAASLDAAALTIVGSHDLTGSSSAVASISATLFEVEKLTATLTSVASVDGSDLTVTGTATPELQLSGFRIDMEYTAAEGADELSGSISAVASISAGLFEVERLSSSIAATASLAAALSQTHRLTAATSAVSSVAADLLEGERLRASISSVVSLAASLTQSHEFTAALSAVASNTAQLTSAAPALTELEASLTAVASLAGTPTQVHTPTAALSSAASLSASLTQSHALAAQVTAVASNSADLLESERLRARVQSVASLAADLTQTHSLAASVQAVSSTAADLTTKERILLAATVSSVASISANLTETEQLSSSISSVASIDAALFQVHEFTAATTSVASIAAVLTNRPPALNELEASLSAVGSLAATATQGHVPVTQLSSAASIDAQLTQVHTPAAQVQAAASLAAQLSETEKLAATLTTAASVVASLTQVHALVAATSVAASVDTAALSIQRNLTATVSAVASSSAALTQTHALASTLQAVASNTAKLDIEGQIEFDVALSAAASVSASLFQAHRLTLASSSVASNTAALSLTTQLQASISAVASSSADLSVTATHNLTASISAVSSTSATLTVSGRSEFTASLSSRASVTATPTQVHQPTSTVSAVSSTSATLSLGFQLAASLSAVASATSSLQLTYHLAVALSAVASTTATPTQVHQALILAQVVASSSANITQISPVTRGYIASMSSELVGDVALADNLVGAVSHGDDG